MVNPFFHNIYLKIVPFFIALALKIPLETFLPFAGSFLVAIEEEHPPCPAHLGLGLAKAVPEIEKLSI